MCARLWFCGAFFASSYIFIFRLVISKFVYWFLILVFCIFDFWSVDRLIYLFILLFHFIFMFFLFSPLFSLFVLCFYRSLKCGWKFSPQYQRIFSRVLASKTDSIVRSYLGGFKTGKRCLNSSSHVCHFPPNPFQVAVYLQCLLNGVFSPSLVFNTVYSINWAAQ